MANATPSLLQDGPSETLIGAGIGYTLATGKLFTDFAAFQEFAESLLSRPILTHEFADRTLWDEMREAFETEMLESD